MKLTELKIPEGCSRVVVEKDGGRIVISFEPENYNDFECKESGCTESYPGYDDIAIFWNKDHEDDAIIAMVRDYGLPKGENGSLFMSNSGIEYDNAVKFRNDIQYRRIINYRKDDTEKK